MAGISSKLWPFRLLLSFENKNKCDWFTLGLYRDYGTPIRARYRQVVWVGVFEHFWYQFHTNLPFKFSEIILWTFVCTCWGLRRLILTLKWRKRLQKIFYFSHIFVQNTHWRGSGLLPKSLTDSHLFLNYRKTWTLDKVLSL